MSSSSVESCSVCAKPGEISRCAGCKLRFYCGRACQRSDWKMHRKACAATPKWYDKHRMCRDGNNHEGRLELVTWESAEHQTGWGACELDQADEMKRYFETELGGDEEKLFKYWPVGFRWTCCGTHARKAHGCDHHGTGTRPCTCDFCRMGKPLPPGIWNEKTPHRDGLTLRRGPDPRSYNPLYAIEAAVGRTILGLEMPES
ncbi:hypothetical protein C8R44DRAFT_647631 [Mycena epipterygia]|nr:hypothetical protein C8R44DRAFT_647631 [Mycena epipterygia]